MKSRRFLFPLIFQSQTASWPLPGTCYSTGQPISANVHTHRQPTCSNRRFAQYTSRPMESCMHISKQVWLMNAPDSQCGTTGGYFSLALYSSSLLMRVSMINARRCKRSMTLALAALRKPFAESLPLAISRARIPIRQAATAIEWQCSLSRGSAQILTTWYGTGSLDSSILMNPSYEAGCLSSIFMGVKFWA